MSNTNTGGPAFPIDRQTAHGVAIHEVGAANEAAYIEATARLSHGMTLLDYFAAKAMQGILANGAMNHTNSEGQNVGEDLSRVAPVAYEIAAAMIKARGEAQ